MRHHDRIGPHEPRGGDLGHPRAARQQWPQDPPQSPARHPPTAAERARAARPDAYADAWYAPEHPHDEAPYQPGGETRPATLLGGSGGRYGAPEDVGLMGSGTDYSWSQRGVHRGRGPRGYARSDERVREDVCERLTDDPLLDASRIEVQVSGGVVTLQGEVEARWLKHHAENLVERCDGVREIENRIAVTRPWGAANREGDAGSRP